MAFSGLFYSPAEVLYEGAGTSLLTPYPYPISVSGHPYQVQWDETAIGVWSAKFKRNTLPLLRTQADASNTPGEQSISPEQFWRRSQESWHYGSGQLHLDDRRPAGGHPQVRQEDQLCTLPRRARRADEVRGNLA